MKECGKFSEERNWSSTGPVRAICTMEAEHIGDHYNVAYNWRWKNVKHDPPDLGVHVTDGIKAEIKRGKS